MSKYQLLALDIDGTTLNQDKKVTENTRYWIKEAIKAGIVVIFATGRGRQTARSIWEDLELDSPMVLVNGAEIWKGPNQLLERHFIDRKYIRKLYELSEEFDARFWGYSVESLTHKNQWTEEMFKRDWLKIGIRHDNLMKIEEIREVVKSWGVLEVTRAAEVNMEATSKGITKEGGVRQVCRHLGISMENVMAIGDNHNDYHLIRGAGLGIAMGNADNTLKQVADKITTSNDNDGVAYAIQNFLLEEKKGKSEQIYK